MIKLKEKRIILISIIILLFIIIISYFFLLSSNSKYIHDTKWDHYIGSDEFYFFSDELNNQKEYLNDYNYEDLNFSLKNGFEKYDSADYKIHYSLECIVLENSNLECDIDGESNNIEKELDIKYICEDDSSKEYNYSKTECNNNNFDWKRVLNTNYHTLTIRKVGEFTADTISVKIIAKSTVPYEKELNKTYELKLKNTKSDIDYQLLKDNSLTCEFGINNNSSSIKEFSISSLNNKYFIESSDYEYVNSTNINISLNPFTGIKLILYKSDFNSSCLKEDIIIN